ncbi:MAG: site-specific integrase, partial [Rhodospirillales bacterium]|nr:site-specific integrase [Rhodospirillales bacterium]
WVIEYGGYPVKSIKTAFRAAAALAGFAPGEVVPYTLRHTAAT